jgi:serine/threonine protein phosphatase 1
MIKEVLAPAVLPAGLRVYAVGDVHGCADRLATLHGLIAAHAARHPAPAALLIHLGDYVDRGPNSAGVIARLADDPVPGIPSIALMGNHEQMMLAALGCLPAAMAEGVSPDPLSHWIGNNGGVTLRSLGVPLAGGVAAWRAAIPPAQLAFLQALRLQHRVGPYLFVHAGLRPGVPLAEQAVHDRMWIRQPFLDWTGDLAVGEPGLVVVHGHTPARTVEILPHRIGVDTGAVVGGDLTCVILEADRVGCLTA